MIRSVCRGGPQEMAKNLIKGLLFSGSEKQFRTPSQKVKALNLEDHLVQVENFSFFTGYTCIYGVGAGRETGPEGDRQAE